MDRPSAMHRLVSGGRMVLVDDRSRAVATKFEFEGPTVANRDSAIGMPVLQSGGLVPRGEMVFDRKPRGLGGS